MKREFDKPGDAAPLTEEVMEFFRIERPVVRDRLDLPDRTSSLTRAAV